MLTTTLDFRIFWAEYEPLDFVPQQYRRTRVVNLLTTLLSLFSRFLLWLRLAVGMDAAMR
jgi:hypothetical protein